MSSKEIYLKGPMSTFFINFPDRKEDNFRVQIDMGENNQSKQNILEQIQKANIIK